eukprot:gb/GFBE01019576.1/.p1 GENE.gb/GFBE01019576.1/~~gb/GFBE01019576.1/.p1  ORF type:complete len:675 (+),score=115.56 gb/GFBE01019576.1/:1-2025(+)
MAAQEGALAADEETLPGGLAAPDVEPLGPTPMSPLSRAHSIMIQGTQDCEPCPEGLGPLGPVLDCDDSFAATQAYPFVPVPDLKPAAAEGSAKQAIFEEPESFAATQAYPVSAAAFSGLDAAADDRPAKHAIFDEPESFAATQAYPSVCAAAFSAVDVSTQAYDPQEDTLAYGISSNFAVPKPPHGSRADGSTDSLQMVSHDCINATQCYVEPVHEPEIAATQPYRPSAECSTTNAAAPNIADEITATQPYRPEVEFSTTDAPVAADTVPADPAMTQCYVPGLLGAGRVIDVDVLDCDDLVDKFASIRATTSCVGPGARSRNRRSSKGAGKGPTSCITEYSHSGPCEAKQSTSLGAAPKWRATPRKSERAPRRSSSVQESSSSPKSRASKKRQASPVPDASTSSYAQQKSKNRRTSSGLSSSSAPALTPASRSSCSAGVLATPRRAAAKAPLQWTPPRRLRGKQPPPQMPPRAQASKASKASTASKTRLGGASAVGSAKAVKSLDRAAPDKKKSASAADKSKTAVNVESVLSTSVESQDRSWLQKVGHTLRPAELGQQVEVLGDGWGNGEGSYMGVITEADSFTFTVVSLEGSGESHVLREHCVLRQGNAKVQNSSSSSSVQVMARAAANGSRDGADSASKTSGASACAWPGSEAMDVALPTMPEARRQKSRVA